MMTHEASSEGRMCVALNQRLALETHSLSDRKQVTGLVLLKALHDHMEITIHYESACSSAHCMLSALFQMEGCRLFGFIPHWSSMVS